MDHASTSATLVLDRPGRSADIDTLDVGSEAAPSPNGSSLLRSHADRFGPGSILRAPGLVLLATLFLIEGYAWLGVLHLSSASEASLLSGRVALALLSVLAPLAAVMLTRGRPVTGWASQDLVMAVAVAVGVATVTALVVGGPAWRTMAGVADLALAGSIAGAVILGERARLRPPARADAPDQVHPVASPRSRAANTRP